MFSAGGAKKTAVAARVSSGLYQTICANVSLRVFIATNVPPAGTGLGPAEAFQRFVRNLAKQRHCHR